MWKSNKRPVSAATPQHAEASDDESSNELSIETFQNMIFFYEEVTKESVLHLIKTLMTMKARLMASGGYKKRIYLFIHSDGGDLHAGMSAMDHIMHLGIEVRTVIDGFVASAATLMFLAGTKRYVMPNANLLIHQLSTEFWGKYQDLKDECANSHGLMETIKSIYLKYTDIPPKDIKSLLKRELYLSADKCLEYKIAHKMYAH